MMTAEEFTEVLEKKLGDSAEVEYWECSKKIRVTIVDFLWFDENWCEIMNEELDEDLILEVIDYLKKICIRSEVDGLVTRYYFDDYCVQVGYTSSDI